MSRSGVRPNRELGQNFLRDPNILGVIGRLGGLCPEDAVLEIGGGEGVLSAYLAPRVAWLHVVEVDERLRDALTAAVAPFANVGVVWGDAMRIDLSELEPVPTKVVANLPYGIAAGVTLRTIEELPGAKMWLVMVQREVGERMAAAPGSGTYGVTSVLAQLAGKVRVVRHDPAHRLSAGAQRRLGAGEDRAHGPRAFRGGAPPGARRVRAPPQGARPLARAEWLRARP